MDPDVLRHAVRTKYREVAACVDGHFPYPTGRAGAEGLGYEATWLDVVPRASIDAFVGVGNPFRHGRPAPGEAVLDVGCGAGLDVFVAAHLAGPHGRVAGLDLTAEMIAVAGRAQEAWTGRAVELTLGTVESMPFEDGAFDRVLSNGALNLVPEKAKAFAEIHRVLRPGGVLACADLVLTEDLPDDVKASLDAWST